MSLGAGLPHPNILFVVVDDHRADAIGALHALQRLGQPEDIAALAALLLSPDAGWITGQVIGIDGGRARLRTKG